MTLGKLIKWWKKIWNCERRTIIHRAIVRRCLLVIRSREQKKSGNTESLCLNTNSPVTRRSLFMMSSAVPQWGPRWPFKQFKIQVIPRFARWKVFTRMCIYDWSVSHQLSFSTDSVPLVSHCHHPSCSRSQSNDICFSSWVEAITIGHTHSLNFGFGSSQVQVLQLNFIELISSLT